MPPGVWVCMWCTCVCHPSTAPHRQRNRLVSVLPAITLALVLTSHTRTSRTHRIKEGVVSQKSRVTPIRNRTWYANLLHINTLHAYTLHRVLNMYWFFARFSIFCPPERIWREGNKGIRYGIESAQNTGRQRTPHTQATLSYVCGAKIALYNVWFSALADVVRGFCKKCQNPLTSPFFDFFDSQIIKTLIVVVSLVSLV